MCNIHIYIVIYTYSIYRYSENSLLTFKNCESSKQLAREKKVANRQRIGVRPEQTILSQRKSFSTVAPPNSLLPYLSSILPLKIIPPPLHVSAPSTGRWRKLANYHTREQSMPSGELASWFALLRCSATSVCIYRLDATLRVHPLSAPATVSYPAM